MSAEDKLKDVTASLERARSQLDQKFSEIRDLNDAVARESTVAAGLNVREIGQIFCKTNLCVCVSYFSDLCVNK